MSDLVAGRELDALIAERVMGAKDIRARDFVDVSCWEMATDLFADFGDKGERDIVPRYSTDIAAAWQVVEKLVSDGAKVNVMSRYVMDGQVWGCWVGRKIGTLDERTFMETAHSVPLAICLAALKAIDA